MREIPNLTFLISQPRAGSTMLQRVLAAHPNVHTTAEPWLMLHPLYALREKGHTAEYNTVLAHTALTDFLDTLESGQKHYDEGLRHFGYHFYRAACQQTGTNHFLDKTPRYYHIILDLARIFPEAKFILLFRNPLAVLASFFSTLVKEHWVLLAHYKHDLLTAPGKLIEGKRQLNQRAIAVNYESLVTDPETNVHAICNHLGIPYLPAMLEYGQTIAPAGRMGDPTSVHQQDRPTNRSLARWLELGAHPQTRHFAMEYLDALGSGLLHQLGYDAQELRSQIEAVPCQTGKIEFTWQQLFEPDETFQKRLTLIELALLEHRRIVHTIRRWRKKFFAR